VQRRSNVWIASRLEAALKLSDGERAQLLSVLTDSLDPSASDDDVLRAWVSEAKRRLDDIRSGASTVIPASEVFRQGREIIEKARLGVSEG
jgi:putative addiction module component (TIGR02574 family)